MDDRRLEVPATEYDGTSSDSFVHTLSLSTKGGLLQHSWVATKLALSVGVIVTGIALVDRLIRQSISAPSGQAVDDSAILGIASAPTTLLISLSVAHTLMLGAATVVAVYKPWGKTWFGRRKEVRPSQGGK